MAGNPDELTEAAKGFAFDEDAMVTASAEFTRWADCPSPPFALGQRITITRGGESTGEYRVTAIQPHGHGSETYTLEPSADVDARTHY
jgi:hypothetical protein